MSQLCVKVCAHVYNHIQDLDVLKFKVTLCYHIFPQAHILEVVGSHAGAGIERTVSFDSLASVHMDIEIRGDGKKSRPSTGGRSMSPESSDEGVTVSQSCLSDLKSSDTTDISDNTRNAKYFCSFESSGTEGPVAVYCARPKRAERIREKLAEYRSEGADWPLTASILDPVRASVVCHGPAQMLDVCKWFTVQLQKDQTWRLTPCRIKNKFSHKRADTV